MTDKFDDCFRDIPLEGPVIVAVSGGSDSLALLLLAHAWLEKQEKGGLLHTVTVDHGLRPEAAAEAVFVASVCAGLDIPHTTLAWEGAKPAFGLPDAARRSRYALLDQFAHEIASNVILTGHTLDDQAETAWMRIVRQSEAGDGRGISAMARLTWLYGGTRVYRPLLGMSRESLRAYLASFPQSWVEDPSNSDESYERVRVRRLLAENPDLKRRALALAKQAGKLRRVFSRDTAKWLKENISVKPGPVFEVSRRTRLEIEGAGPAKYNPVAEHGLQIILAIAGGREHLVPRGRMRKVFDMLAMPGDGKMTLGGAVAEKAGSVIRFYRERRNLSEMLVEPGEAAIWDGRMHIYNGSANPVLVEPANRTIIQTHEAQTGRALSAKPAAALRSTPVLYLQSGFDTGEDTCFPLIENTGTPAGISLRLASPAIEHFCPDFDSPLRDWVRSLDPHLAASLQPKG